MKVLLIGLGSILAIIGFLGAFSVLKDFPSYIYGITLVMGVFSTGIASVLTNQEKILKKLNEK